MLMRSIIFSCLIFMIFFPLFGFTDTNCNYADLSITMSDNPDPVTAGQDLTYTVIATNNGPYNAKDVVVTVVLAPGLSYVLGPQYCAASANTVTCNVGEMTTASSQNMDLIVHIDPALSGYVGCAGAIQSLNPDEIDPVPGNNTVNIETFVLGPVLALSINDIEISEPESNTADAIFTVTLSESSSFEVRVDYATADNTAVAGADYLETHGTLTFPAETTEAFITVPVLADAINMEGSETFFVNLTNATFGIIADPQGVGTINESCLFCDHFDDNILRTDWTYTKPCWTENGHALVGKPCASGRTAAIATPAFSGAGACEIEAFMLTEGGPGNRLWLLAWYQDKKNTVELIMKEESDKWVLRQKANGKTVMKKKISYPIEPNIKYEVGIYSDGNVFQFFVNHELLAEAPVGSVLFGTVGFKTKATTARFCKIYVN